MINRSRMRMIVAGAFMGALASAMPLQYDVPSPSPRPRKRLRTVNSSGQKPKTGNYRVTDAKERNPYKRHRRV